MPREVNIDRKELVERIRAIFKREPGKYSYLQAREIAVDELAREQQMARAEHMSDL